MEVVLYARVSHEDQNKGDKVSIEQQLSDMRALCERMGWSIAGEYIDAENYLATQPPKKGKVVNPSGERADRPAFLEMLRVIKSGTPDSIVCWRDDRLVRHPRVAVALEDALDLGDARHGGRKMEIHDATGATIDRFTLSIKATIWREENKRRAERVRMGKTATLTRGFWPGTYHRLGYSTHKDGRGRS
jgi:DNA invertase Pin-like site-specific DNA recombinase